MKDTVTYFTLMRESQTIPDTVYKALKTVGRTCFTKDSLDAVSYSHRQGNKKFGYALFRMALFKNEMFLNAFDYAVFASPSYLNQSDLHVITAVLEGDTIKQYKIQMEIHYEPYVAGRLGEEDFYYTFHDTLATSKLVIKPDGRVLGKNLVHWW